MKTSISALSRSSEPAVAKRRQLGLREPFKCSLPGTEPSWPRGQIRSAGQAAGTQWPPRQERPTYIQRPRMGPTRMLEGPSRCRGEETEKPRVQSKAGGTLGQVAFGSCCRSGGQWAPGRAERGTFHTPGGENRGTLLGSQEGPPLTHATYVLPMGAQSRTQSSPHWPPDSPLPLLSKSKTHAETMAPALHPPGTPHWEHRQ